MKIRHLLILVLIGLVIRPMMAQGYKLGDVITNDDGSRGVVFYVNPDGSGGWMVALTDASTGCVWGDLDDDIPTLVNQSPSFTQQLLNDTDGYGNTEKIRAYHQYNSNYYDYYYYAAWKVDFDHGWYLPSIGQLRRLFGNLAKIEGAITAAGGSVLSEDNYYWSSTEKDSSDCWVINFRNSIGLTIWDISKYNFGRVRAIHDFGGEHVVYDTTLFYYWNTGATTPSIEVSPTQTTTYTVTATTEFGCSATVQQTVFVNSSGTEHVYDTVCAGYDYSGYGFDLTPEQTQTQGEDSFSREIGEGDCTVTLTLHLYKQGSTAGPTITASTCENEAYYYNGYAYSVAGTYHQYYTAASGCDSVITINLSVLPVSSSTIEQETCHSLTWNGEVYTESGTYEQTLQNQYGCDSIVILHLELANTYETYLDTVQCGSFWFNGQAIDSSGYYEGVFVSSDGCDSIVHLHLTLEPSEAPVLEGEDNVYVATNLLTGIYHYEANLASNVTHFEWSLTSPGWLMDTIGTNCTLTVLSPGTGILTLHAWNECGYSETQKVINAGFFDVMEHETVFVNVYPNPARNKVVVESEGIMRIRMYSMKGQLLQEINGNGDDSVEISLRDYASAPYMLEVMTPKGLANVKLNVVR